MRATFRIASGMLDDLRRDLERSHEFAFERVGFVFCRFGSLGSDGIVILAHAYMPLLDEEYIDDSRFGALIGPGAFRRALEYSLESPVGIFHMHMHSHEGPPTPSRIDLDESAKFVPDFFHIRGRVPHGALIASRNSMSGRIWISPTGRPTPIAEIGIVGAPLQYVRKGS